MSRLSNLQPVFDQLLDDDGVLTDLHRDNARAALALGIHLGQVALLQILYGTTGPLPPREVVPHDDSVSRPNDSVSGPRD